MIGTRAGKLFMIGSICLGFGLTIERFQSLLGKGFLCLAIVFLSYTVLKNVWFELVYHHDLQVDLLMILSAAGAISIEYFSEAAILLFIFSGSEVLEDYVYRKSLKTMESLMTQIPKQASLVREDGVTVVTAIEQIEVGNRLVVKKGEQIALDGIAQQKMLIDESLLTGESRPVAKEINDVVFAGTLNIGETSTYLVRKKSSESVFSHIVELVEQASRSQSKRDKFLHQLQKSYVIGVLGVVILFIIGLIQFQQVSFAQAFYRGMILLTVASPCALIASITPAMLSAMSFGAKNGILIKNGDALEKMSQLSILFSDKTGTLTEGQFRVSDYYLENSRLLPYIVYMEQQSSHPLAQSIVSHFKRQSTLSPSQKFSVQEIAGYGLQMGDISIGNKRFVEDFLDSQDYLTKESQGTLLFVAQKEEVVGYIELVDTVRKEAKEMIQTLRHEGVEVVMLTGDRKVVASKVAEELQIKTFHAECLPEDKVSYMKQQKTGDNIVGMIGDGINDAPILANADISIAMGSGTDIAMDASDVIVTQNNLQKIGLLFKLSKYYSKITRFNILFSVGVILLLILLNLLGYLDLTQGVFFHETSTILVILNGLRLLSFE
ncbi:heavy metal translocating P-type ATPase [Streptococcus sp. ZJ100]|uniref:heavy metal translocating P-type ATPase n=1 Tax=Streptococcus handemini TaxID=3161188 RepID=UPI0032EABAB6